MTSVSVCDPWLRTSNFLSEATSLPAKTHGYVSEGRFKTHPRYARIRSRTGPAHGYPHREYLRRHRNRDCDRLACVVVARVVTPRRFPPPWSIVRNRISPLALSCSDGDSPPAPHPQCRRSKPLCDERGGFSISAKHSRCDAMSTNSLRATNSWPDLNYFLS